MSITADFNGALSSIKVLCRKLIEDFNWGIDRGLNKALGKTSFSPVLIEREVIKSINRGVKIFSHNIYVPNKVTVMLHPRDLGRISPYMNIFSQELKECVKKHIADNIKHAKNAGQEVAIKIVEDAGVMEGEPLCEAELVDWMHR